MTEKTKEYILKYSIPSLAVLVIAIHFFFVNTQNLNAWKGGGYGMYTGIHYQYNQIYIPGMSVDSLIGKKGEMKSIFDRLKLMPNKTNLKKAAILVLKTRDKDSVHIQIWKPAISRVDNTYTRVLIDEIYLKNSEL
ncbi:MULTISPECIES: hypothetical protein [Winogradskyella]|uniref:hypothetical protein n=1 Tax=Winogradskyella TaxID=286104 RepID=UPI0015CCDA84|nr:MULTISPECIES: hypothetical protein [Winogradskyella]QXP78576.1 hypothetical protein H0I32_15385 [Winogradskyella sp. HaHa_3_26]